MQQGFYPAISEDAYYSDTIFGDDAPPTLNNSLVKILNSQSPQHAWVQHPRLNPAYQPKHAAQFDRGKACQALIYGGEDQIVVIDAADYRTKAAKEQRDTARAAGKFPMLTGQVDEAVAMFEALERQLAVLGDNPRIFRGGVHEGTAVWKEGTVWCRARIDWLIETSPGHWLAVDYKTTETSVRPDDYERTFYNLGYHLQAEFYSRGIEATMDAKSVTFGFIAQEVSPPYAIAPVKASAENAGPYAREQVDNAIKVWEECLATDQWPGYPVRWAELDPPRYMAFKWDDESMQRQANPNQFAKACQCYRPHSEKPTNG